MTIAPAERQYLLSQVDRLAQQDLDRLWQVASALSTVDFFTYVRDAFPALVDPYHQAAAQMAATWFEDSLPVSTYVAATADPISVERLAKSADWALGATGDAGRLRLSGTLQRAVFDGARDTTLLNVQATDSKWARYASATACAFCRLLATRKGAYRSRNTAAAKVHDDCHCIPVEVRQGRYDPPSYVGEWERQYVEARRAAGSGNVKAVLSEMRKLDT